jgi:benzoate-CoA ligase family protein
MTEAPRRFNAAEDLVDTLMGKDCGDRVALRADSARYTYGQIAAMINRAGNTLRAAGVEMENRVLLLLEDSVEFVAAFLGSIKIGAVPVPVSTLLHPSDYGYLLEDSRARIAVAHQELWDHAAVDAAAREHLRRAVVVRGTEDFAAWIGTGRPELSAAPTCPDDAAFWLYTSGSTGRPKAAIHVQTDMAHCADLYARQVLGLGPDDVVLSAAKLFFAYGLGNSLYFPFRAGASSILVRARPRPELMFETISREHPTLFFGVPTLYASMLAVEGAERRYDLSSLRLCVSAGEPLPAELYARWGERFGVEILDGIGSTEALHIFISNRPGQARPGSTGTVVPGYEARIVDDTGVEAGPHQIGNLLVKGPTLCAGYWNRRDRTRQTLQGEWIATGDKYYRDEEGYYWFCGRSDDMLKVGGIWVSPAEVEGALAAHPAVLEAAVVGKEDLDGLVKPRAFVVLRDPEAAVAEDELKNFVRSRLAPYKAPRSIVFLPELPKTPTGKIQRFKLRQQ